MLVKNLFLFFGIALALIAVVVSIIGLRREGFPNRKTLIGLIALTLVFVAGTATFAVELSIEEAEEREEHKKDVIGEEASIEPLRAPDSA
jgi:predicted membrane-bound spermidine synthase